MAERRPPMEATRSSISRTETGTAPAVAETYVPVRRSNESVVGAGPTNMSMSGSGEVVWAEKTGGGREEEAGNA